jgi:hypothetical protein
MAIARPTTKTIISTTGWGIPITDAVNQNTTDIAAMKPTAWTAVTFLNGWHDFGGGYQTAQYRKVGDIVYVRGTIANSGTPPSVCFTLPAGFRPLATMMFPAAIFTTQRQILAIMVSTAGNVTIYDYMGNVDLNTIQFSTI